MRSCAALLAIALACALWAAGPAAAAPEGSDPAASMYDHATVDVIKLGLPQSSIEGLEDEPDEYQPGTFSLAESDGTPGGVGEFSAPINVEARLKGHSTFQDLKGKAAFKLKFAKTERFLGLRKMTLNNLLEDPSMLHETLSYAMFRAAGVPAERTGFAYLQVNEEDFGLYLNLETLDDVSLARLFGSFDDEAQHLYEGENAADVKPGGAVDYEVDEGPDDVSDLEALIAAVNGEGAGAWSERVAPFADLEEMTRMWAVEKYIAHWDGYSGRAGEHQPNNYYLYSDPSGRFQMLPWGTDETWGEGREVTFDGAGGLMFNLCLADAECTALYEEALIATGSAAADLNLPALALDTADLLAPWQELEAEEWTRERYELSDIARAVDSTREFIAGRPAQLQSWLDQRRPPPPPPPPPPSPPGQAPAPPSAQPQEAPRRARPLRVEWARLRGRVILTRVSVVSAGTVVQRARGRAGGRSFFACTEKRRVTRPGTLTLRCALSARAKKLARRGRLRVRLVTRFRARGGDEVLVRHLGAGRR